MNAFYYYKTTGIINVDKSNMPESQRSLGPAACMPGYPIVEDKNGDGIIDVNDSYMDNTLPKLYFGFGNTFTWKNFCLLYTSHYALLCRSNHYVIYWWVHTCHRSNQKRIGRIVGTRHAKTFRNPITLCTIRIHSCYSCIFNVP